MIIICEKCNTKFNLDENLLKQTGSKVRCSKCQNIFMAYPLLELENSDLSDEEIIQQEKTDSDIEMPDFKISNSGHKEEKIDFSDIDNLPEEFETKEDKPDLPGLDLEEIQGPEIPEKTDADKKEDIDLSGIDDLPEESEPDLSGLDFEKAHETEIDADKEEDIDLSGIDDFPEESEPDLSGLDLEKTHGTEIDADKKFKITEETSEIEEESFDLYDIEKMFVEDQKTKSSFKKDSPDSYNLELELEDDEKNRENQPENEKTSGKEKTAVEAGIEPSEAGEDKLKTSQLDEIEEPEHKTEKTPIINNEQKIKSVRKKYVSTPILIILIITLLAGGLYGGYIILENLNIKIPFIGTLSAPDVYDAGNLHINILDVSDKFINNSKSEKLFIVSGTVKNEYSQARSFIRIGGKLYDKEKNILKHASVYCGNLLSENDLSTMDISLINQKLANRMGDNSSNVNLKPGKTLKFMMVFPYSSGNIEEYSIKVMSSSPA